MPAFAPDEIRYREPDVRAILECHGLLTIPESDETALRAWLQTANYVTHEIDFSQSFRDVRRQIGTLFRWEERFGYRYEDAEGNLDALNDGFCFEVSSGMRTALIARRCNAFNGREGWLEGFLGIAAAHSLYQLAIGARFFTVLPLPDGCGLMGRTVEVIRVPHRTWPSV